jgi:hypothetical protein
MVNTPKALQSLVSHLGHITLSQQPQDEILAWRVQYR